MQKSINTKAVETLKISTAYEWSGLRDSNSRPSRWQRYCHLFLSFLNTPTISRKRASVAVLQHCCSFDFVSLKRIKTASFSLLRCEQGVKFYAPVSPHESRAA